MVYVESNLNAKQKSVLQSSQTGLDDI